MLKGLSLDIKGRRCRPIKIKSAFHRVYLEDRVCCCHQCQCPGWWLKKAVTLLTFITFLVNTGFAPMGQWVSSKSDTFHLTPSCPCTCLSYMENPWVPQSTSKSLDYMGKDTKSLLTWRQANTFNSLIYFLKIPELRWDHALTSWGRLRSMSRVVSPSMNTWRRELAHNQRKTCLFVLGSHQVWGRVWYLWLRL